MPLEDFKIHLLCRATADHDHFSNTHQRADEVHVLEEFNRSLEPTTVSLPKEDGSFHGIQFIILNNKMFFVVLLIKKSNMIFNFTESDTIRMFTCKKLRYVWNEKTKEFFRLKSLGPGLPTSSLHCPDAQQGLAGLTVYQQQKR